MCPFCRVEHPRRCCDPASDVGKYKKGKSGITAGTDAHTGLESQMTNTGHRDVGPRVRDAEDRVNNVNRGACEIKKGCFAST